MSADWLTSLVLCLCLAPAAAASANETTIAAGLTIASHGITPERPGCASCHLANGAGQPEVGIPRLAGLTASYIAAQLGYFANGARHNSAMAPYARALAPAQRQELADYYASLPVPAPTSPELPAPDTLARGSAVFLNGDAATGLLACAECHGQTALGVGDFSPALAGQSAAYVEDKLLQWHAGALRDPKGAFMRAEASHLSQAQIEAVAAYVASLSDQEPSK